MARLCSICKRLPALGRAATGTVRGPLLRVSRAFGGTDAPRVRTVNGERRRTPGATESPPAWGGQRNDRSPALDFVLRAKQNPLFGWGDWPAPRGCQPAQPATQSIRTYENTLPSRQRALGQSSRLPEQIWPGPAKLRDPKKWPHGGATAHARGLRESLPDVGPKAEQGTARPVELRGATGDEPSALGQRGPLTGQQHLRAD